MRLYVDANVLVRLYLSSEGSEARSLVMSAECRRAWPLPVTSLLRCEIGNAIQRMAYESHHGSAFRFTREGAAASWGEFTQHLDEGEFLKNIALTIEQIVDDFERLVARHTAKHGFRTYDILHVASALHLGCDTFWSFDAKALKLARLEGLKTNR